MLRHLCSSLLVVDGDFAVETEGAFDLFGVGGGGCTGDGDGRVEGHGGEHDGGRVDEVHGLERGAVELVHVEAKDVVVRVSVDGVAL